MMPRNEGAKQRGRLMFGRNGQKPRAFAFAGAVPIINMMEVPAFVLDADRKVMAWNAALEELTGLKANRVLGTQDHWQGFYDHQRPCLADLLYEGEVQGAGNLYTNMAGADLSRRKAENWCHMPLLGRKRYLEIVASAVRDDAGRILAVVETLKDLTAEREAKAALEAAERDRQVQQYSLVSGSLGQALAKLASGDLTHRIEAGLPEWSRQLMTDFNAAAEKLQSVLIGLSDRADSIQDGSQQISTAIAKLSERTEQQGESLQRTVVSVAGIGSTVKRATKGASEARNAVATAKSDAEQSGGIVRSAVSAMDSIETSSKQIGQIIGVIDEIAFQTSLLALNAGVEAARAGDAGRGFAVVASEVRALAQRSAEAAKEIKTLISTSGEHVQHGVALVGQAGTSLSRIASQVGDINGVVGEIAATAEAQAKEVDEVKSAIREMEQVTKQNAAMVEETTGVGTMLLEEVDQLTAIIARFKTGRNAGSRRSVGARPAGGARPASGARPVSRPPAAGVANPSNLARKVELENWDEF